LRTLLPEVADPLSPSERQLLGDWLDRLAGASTIHGDRGENRP
jgi:hypothetical protein